MIFNTKLAKALGIVFVVIVLIITMVALLIHKARKAARLERSRLNRIDGCERGLNRNFNRNSRGSQPVVVAPFENGNRRVRFAEEFVTIPL